MPFLALLGRIPLKFWLAGAAVAAIGFLVWREHHAVQVAHQQRARAEQAEATLVAERKAKVAEVAHAQENADTTQFRADNPLHGGLCINPNLPAYSAKRLYESPGATAANLQPVPSGDSGAGGQRDPDIRHMLDLLGARADEVSAELREWQGR